MKIVESVNELRKNLDALNKNIKVGFVPTMGALHKGHASLVKNSKKHDDYTVVSIFVNPTQFNDKNDLKNYPRTLQQDCALLESLGCDMVFVPSVEEVYPQEDTRVFDFGMIDKVMEGEHRPGHFNGVAQVVSKLFDMVKPNRAYFGLKDFQQVAVIKSMIDSLALDIEIVECPIERDIDGLALSSRNVLLNAEQRVAAPVIYMTLKESVSRKEWCDVEQLKKWVIEQIDSNDLMKVEYFDIVDPLSLQSIDSWQQTTHPQGCIAVKVGNIRLIDNILYI